MAATYGTGGGYKYILYTFQWLMVIMVVTRRDVNLGHCNSECTLVQWSWKALPSSKPPRPPSSPPSSGGGTRLPNEIRLAKFEGRGFILRSVFIV